MPTVLVLYGDVPLVNRTTLHETATLAGRHGIALITAAVGEPSGYGRIVRDPDGHVRGIVEDEDASEEQRDIAEINTGILAAGAKRLRGWLQGLSCDNAQGEYYLTDVVARAAEEGLSVRTVPPEAIRGSARGQRPRSARGAGAISAAAACRSPHARGREPRRSFPHRHPGPRAYRKRRLRRRERRVRRRCRPLAIGVSIGPGCVIKDTVIEDDTEVRAHCVIEGGARRHRVPNRPILPAAFRYAVVAERAHRELRGDQESRTRRGLQGEPPHLHRGQPHRPGRQRGRWSRHLQLRRHAQAHDDHRKQRFSSARG